MSARMEAGQPEESQRPVLSMSKKIHERVEEKTTDQQLDETPVDF